MIIYDLRCEKGHKFEGWFKDRQSFEEQHVRKIITCPSCGSSETEMVPSSIAILGKEAKAADRTQAKEITLLRALQTLHEYLDKNFDDVGSRFAEVALRIHYGEEEKRNIKGTSTSEEEAVLKEEGVQFVKVPTIKFDS